MIGVTVTVMVSLLAPACFGVQALGIITKRSGQKIKGYVRWKGSTDTYYVKRRGVDIPVPLREVYDLQIQKPATFDKGYKLLRAGQLSAGIPILETVVKDYEMLKWDVRAAALLAEAYTKMNQPAKAVRMLDRIMEKSPEALTSGKLARLYWQGLKDTGQVAKLRRVLKKSVQQGSREVAAVAQIMRGDIERDGGNLQDALIDGYLRTVVMFRDVKSVQPEAIFKAHECFKQLGQVSHAERMRKKLLQEYPGDPYTAKIR
jgi:lipopolysaccharide biosynthesis regulator YciM